MKKTLLIPVLLLTSILSHSQFIYKIKADSVLITNDSCNAELNLENSTKDTIGFLYNKGKGRTEFRRGFIRLNDSLYVIGNDTLNIAQSVGGNFIRNQSSAAQAASAWINGTLRADGKTALGIPAGGSITAKPNTKLQVGAVHWADALLTVHANETTPVLRSLAAFEMIRDYADGASINPLVGTFMNGYARPGTSGTFVNTYQNGVLSALIEGGILNKAGVSTTNLQAGTSPHTSTSSVVIKFLTQGNTQHITGWVSPLRLSFSRFGAAAATGTIQNYADLIVGSTDGTGNITNRYGVYIISMGSSATNKYGVYQAGATDKNYFAGKTIIGNNSDSTSALLQLNSTTQGFLPPVMTTTQRNAIASPVAGLSLYNTTLNTNDTYNGSEYFSFGNQIILPATNTATGTTGNQTINKVSGTVNIAASGTSVTITNNLVSPNSIVTAVLRTNDATAYIKNVVPGTGTITINLGAAATGEVNIGFVVFN